MQARITEGDLDTPGIYFRIRPPDPPKPETLPPDTRNPKPDTRNPATLPPDTRNRTPQDPPPPDERPRVPGHATPARSIPNTNRG